MTLLNDRYHLEAELGHGGMDVIYRAYDLLLDRPVAVKVLIHQELGTQGGTRLNYPNIVAIYDVGFARCPAQATGEANAHPGGQQGSSGFVQSQEAAPTATQRAPYIVMELPQKELLLDRAWRLMMVEMLRPARRFRSGSHRAG